MAKVVEKKLVRSISGYRMVSVDESLANPFTLPEPEWIDDKLCSHCQNIECQGKFGVMNRRHHCRRCGRCFCDSCCKNKLALPRMCFIDPVRHCATCYNITKKENEFFDKTIKILLIGGRFHLHPENDHSNLIKSKTFRCLLSTDNRYIEFEGDIEDQERILVDKIESVQIAAAQVDQQGNQVGTGIAIRYQNCIGNSVRFKMEVVDDADRKQSMSWVAAMQRAFKMVHDARRPTEN